LLAGTYRVCNPGSANVITGDDLLENGITGDDVGRWIVQFCVVTQPNAKGLRVGRCQTGE